MFKDVIKQINDTPFKVAITVTGGGQSFVSNFLKYGGASKTIEDFQVPYGQKSLDRFCGKHIEKSVTLETVRLMATKSFANCCQAVEPNLAIGIGLSASLATDNERVGRIHKIYMAVHCVNFSQTVQLELSPGLTREQEEELCYTLILRALTEVCYITAPALPIKVDFSFVNRVLIFDSQHNGSHWFNFEVDESIDHLVLAPGSYNPWHSGHKEMFDLAEDILGIRPIAEITAWNADKGVIDYFDMFDRTSFMSSDCSTVVTYAKTFLDKAKQFYLRGRRIDFVIGTDTWNRLLDPKYAGPMKELYDEFIRMNVRFLVFNRDGHAMLSDEYMNQLLILDSRTETFRNPISSTELRAKAKETV